MSMADKYRCDDIRCSLAEYFAGNWPSSLAEWVDMDARDINKRKETFHIAVSLETFWRPRILPEPAQYINFVVRYGKSGMEDTLPAILYDLTRCEPGDMEKLDPRHPALDLADYYYLRPQDIALVEKAREEIMEVIDDIEHTINHTISHRCEDVAGDRRKLEGLYETIKSESAMSRDILRILTKRMGVEDDQTLHREIGLCRKCTLLAHNILRRARDSVWRVVDCLADEYGDF